MQIREDALIGKILITGASGMLGSELVRSLQEFKPHIQLFGLVHKSPLPEGVLVVEEAGLKPGSFDAALHLGSPASPSSHIDPLAVCDANVRLTHKVLESLKPGGTFMFFSTGEVYGPKSALGITESEIPSPVTTGPRSYYPLSKLMGESIANSRFDVRSVVFRVFHTFGPGLRSDDGRAFADFLWGAALNGRVSMSSDGSSVRSFMYLADFSSAVLLALEDESVKGTYNLGSSNPMTLRQFAERVSEVTKKPIAQANSLSLGSPIKELTPNTSKLENHGWSRKFNEDDAILHTWNWIISALRTA